MATIPLLAVAACALAHLVAGTHAAAAGAAGAALAYTPPPRGVPPAAVQLQDGALVSASGSGTPIRLRTAVWGDSKAGSTFSGFLASHEPSSLTAALAAGTYSLLQQGVTSIQLPFAFSDLLPPPGPAAISTQGTKAAAAPTPQPQPHQQQCWQVPYNSIKLRPGGSSSGNDSSSAPCVSMLPNTTALDRYLWSVQWFAAHGLYVTLSSSSSSSCSTNSSSSGGCSDADADAYGSAHAFAAAWSAAWRAVAALPRFASDLQGRLFLQLLSNPAAGSYRWEGGGSGSSGSGSDATTHQQLPGLGERYLAAMDAIEAVTPGAALFVLPGADQSSPHDGSAWGHGFAAEPAMLAAGLSDPTPFLTALLAKPYRTRVMLAPHALGPSSEAPAAATNAQPPAAPGPVAAAADVTAEATKILDNSFNKLTSIGFCAAKECQRFPVALPAGRQPAQLQLAAQADVEAFAAHLQEQGEQEQGQAAMQQPPGNWLLWDFAADTPAGDDDSSTAQPGGSDAVAKQPDGRKLAAAADLRPVAGSPEASTGHNTADEDSRRAFAYVTGGGGSVLIISDDAAA